MDELKLESFDEVNVLLPRLLSILPPMGGIHLGWNHWCENKARSSSPSARGPGDFPKTRRLIAWFCRMKNAQSCPFKWLRSSFGWNLAGNVVKSKTSGPYSSLTVACEFSLTSSFFRCGNLGLLNLRPNSQLDSCFSAFGQTGWDSVPHQRMWEVLVAQFACASQYLDFRGFTSLYLRGKIDSSD